eukprot:8200526-Ditylum_brightwellii.AAC.1
MSTRSSTLEGSGIKDLAGLSDNQIKELKEVYKVKLLQDLALLDKDNVDTILGTDANTFKVRRKLFSIAETVRKWNNLTPTMIMSNVLSLDGTPSKSTGSLTGATKSMSPICLSPTNFPVFFGEIEDQENYKTKAEAQIGQTAFKFFLRKI